MKRCNWPLYGVATSIARAHQPRGGGENGNVFMYGLYVHTMATNGWLTVVFRYAYQYPFAAIRPQYGNNSSPSLCHHNHAECGAGSSGRALFSVPCTTTSLFKGPQSAKPREDPAALTTRRTKVEPCTRRLHAEGLVLAISRCCCGSGKHTPPGQPG